ncbi:MAG TPA: Gfo/Idh/MocA family oxidoreductase [bacterium]|nr:Gfo/Idh/MocA family oxidoreductase [bacterium]HPO07280.1 Gfo/Idh/MocA family oxidoreductase [bacterium]HQO33092.1 Gfo/Idh/MocA family oxidoreductase [bacterium]HQP97241.1 Gfo/Idh/MocA family oxidoreductase [bacterium]
MDTKDNVISRREFAKRATVGATTFASLGIATSSFGANGDPLKIALIGCGGRGKDAVKNAIQADRNIKLIAVHDVVEQRAKDAPNQIKESLKKDDLPVENIQVDPEHTFSGLNGYKDLLKLDMDYVIIATPPGFRPIHFEEAVQAKKNIFTEKPVGTDPTGIRRFLRAARRAERAKLSIVAGTQRRHQKEYVETIARIHDGALGEILAGRAYWNGGLPFARERQPGMSDLEYQASYNWYNFCWICGDNIVEQHVHNLDVMNWVFQAHPISVIASGGRTWKPQVEKYGNIWDNFSCDYEYPKGIHVMSFSRHWMNCYSEVSELVIGTNRTFKEGLSTCHDMAERGVNAYVQEHADLQASIRGTGPHLNEGVQVAESTFTAIFGRMAAYTGQKLMWDEAMDMELDIMPKKLGFDIEIPIDPIPVPPVLG